MLLISGSAVLLLVLLAVTLVGGCGGGQIDLKGRGVPQESTVDGKLMRVTFGLSDTKTEMVLIDVCKGKITGSLTVETDPVTKDSFE